MGMHFNYKIHCRGSVCLFWGVTVPAVVGAGGGRGGYIIKKKNTKQLTPRWYAPHLACGSSAHSRKNLKLPYGGVDPREIARY